jgi:hypothetical protein
VVTDFWFVRAEQGQMGVGDALITYFAVLARWTRL